MRAFYYLIFLVLLSCLSLTGFAGTTGKIAGTVTDARTGDKLPSVNVVIEGTTLGAVSNVDGYFTILNVPPGRYRLKASLVGYATAIIADVRVEIDQTTLQNFSIGELAVAGEEITVIAQRPVVERDVAASRANIEIADVQKLPVVNIASAVGLQAGIQGLSIRGGYTSETAFMVDGTMMRDERTSAPYSSVSLLSVQDIQVQSGGFSAEYGQVRSGIVNVVTKEGSKSKYTVGFLGRYSGESPKHFGASVYDKNSYWIRPYIDGPVALYGTSAIDPATGKPYWDKYTQAQYPAFEGWNSIAAKQIGTSTELTPAALQELFLFERRRVAEISDGDYNYDFSFGGPIPFVSEALGNLRFFSTYHKTQTMYLVPLSENAFRDYNGMVKLTSDLTTTMKLSVEGLIGRKTGSNDRTITGVFQTPESVAGGVSFGAPFVSSSTTYLDTRIFATDYFAPTSTDYASLTAKLSHAVNATTYYDASISMFRSAYNTNPGDPRNTAKIYKFGNNYYVDEAPFGFDPLPNPAQGLIDLRMGIGFSNTRDTSVSTSYTAKFDLTSQLNQTNEVKTGFEFTYSDQNIRYGLYDAYLTASNYSDSYHRFPIRGALYAKDKLEFEGMIADLGVRMDYLDPQGKWYAYDPYSPAFSSNGAAGMDTLFKPATVDKQVTFSPRVGISFPISEDAKLYFNYGHFRQQPTPNQLFLLQRSYDKSITFIADPNIKMPRTIAYELGYEHSIADEYLLRVAAYYKDISDELQSVTYTSSGSLGFAYTKYTSNGYRDIRGFEITASKKRGNWIQGFINYTYDVTTSGYFGDGGYFQVPKDQTNYDLTNVPQSKPLPQPYARLNVDFFTPVEFGPVIFGQHLLGDFRLNIVGNWSSGDYFTWTGGSTIPGVQNNVQWTDYLNFDVRLSKNFNIGALNLQLYMDVTNLFNYKQMSGYGFSNGADYQSYMESLHLPAFSQTVNTQLGYVNISGSDRPGDYRLNGAQWQPIESYGTYAAMQQIPSPETRPFYYAADQGRYYQWVNSQWQQVDPNRLQQVLDNKAYIDMPNLDTYTFLNPRRWYFGLRMSLDI